MIAEGSDEFSRGLPISAMLSMLEAMQKLGIGTSALFSPQAMVLVEDGTSISAGSGQPSSIACEAGLAVSLPPGSIATIERSGGRSIHLAAPLGSLAYASLAPIDEAQLARAASRIDPLAARWLASGERGSSSEALCKLFFGVPKEAGHSHPCDPSDLARCVAFLEATNTEGRIQEACALSPQWASLASRWDELLAHLSREWPTGSAPDCYQAMRALTDPPRPKHAP